jgi:hypothetical protein
VLVLVEVAAVVAVVVVVVAAVTVWSLMMEVAVAPEVGRGDVSRAAAPKKEAGAGEAAGAVVGT